MNITRETVLYVARLARLRLTDEEVPRMQRDLDAILDYVATLRELDTTGVPRHDPRARHRDAAATRRGARRAAGRRGGAQRAAARRERDDRAEGARVSEIWKAGLGELALHVESGDVSCREIVAAALARIERFDRGIGAFLRVRGEAALAEARAADEARAAGARARGCTGCRSR